MSLRSEEGHGFSILTWRDAGILPAHSATRKRDRLPALDASISYPPKKRGFCLRAIFCWCIVMRGCIAPAASSCSLRSRKPNSSSFPRRSHETGRMADSTTRLVTVARDRGGHLLRRHQLGPPPAACSESRSLAYAPSFCPCCTSAFVHAPQTRTAQRLSFPVYPPPCALFKCDSMRQISLCPVPQGIC